MSDHSSSPSLTAFLAGAVLGAAAALLLAPRSGRDTRRRLARWLEEWEDETKDLLAEGGELLREQADKVRRRVKDAAQDVAKEFGGRAP